MGQGVSLMTYLVGTPQQARVFMYAVGFGFLIGILYDVFRTIRMLVSNGKKAFMVFDVLYAFTAAILTFLFLLTVQSGRVRGFVLFGELLGFLIYYISFGLLVVRVSDKIVHGLRRFFKGMFRLVTKPICRIANFFKRFFTKNVQKAQKKAKNSVKKSKFHLKSIRNMLYNQSDRVSFDDEKSLCDESDGRKNESKKKK